MNGREGQFDLFDFLDYIRRRWRVTVTSCGVAVIAAACASFLIPEKFTATASILIDPPAGNDPRASTAVSPVYLESLKTYEHFASSDTLFGQAIDHLHIRSSYPGVAPESLKRRVLKVSKPRDTKILEISATLSNPVQAQALAQFVAEQTVGLSRLLEHQSENDITEDARKLVEAAADRLKEADRAWSATAVTEPVDALQAELDSAGELSGRLQRRLMEARADLADELALRALASSGRTDDTQSMDRQIVALKARTGALTQSLAEIKARLQASEALLEKRKADRERLQSERKAALAHLESATTRLNEMKFSSAWRGERLKVIDPSIVPQKPSSPNPTLLIASALLISLVASMFYTAAAFSFEQRRRFEVEDAYAHRARR